MPDDRAPRPTALHATVVCVALALACAAGLAPAPAAAQQARRGAPRVIQLDEIQIEGRVQKPNAFYILNRSQLGYEVEDLRASFMVRNVIRSVRREPF